MNFKSRFHFRSLVRANGFTLVEILVAMVVMAIGLLGMVAMLVTVIKGNTSATSQTAATNICQQKIEELKDVNFEELGLGDMTNSESYGLPGGAMVQEGSITAPGANPLLNAQGKTEEEVCEEVSVDDVCDSATEIENVRKAGPYKFSRTFVVCRGDDYQDDGTPPINTALGSSASPATGEHARIKDCLVDPNDNTTRVQSLACESSDILNPGSDSREIKIKVLCAWRARDGQCHSVNFATTKMSLD